MNYAELYQEHGSLRAIQSALAEKGVHVSHETIRKRIAEIEKELGERVMAPHGSRETKPMPTPEWLYQKIHVEKVPLRDYDTFGASPSTITRWCDTLGVTRPSKWTERRGGREFVRPSAEQAAADYARYGNTSLCGDHWGCSRETARKLLRKLGVPLKERGFRRKNETVSALAVG